MVQVPSDQRLAELRTDLQVERTKLALLVESLAALQRTWSIPEGAQERCDAAALRLQSLYTGIERCFVQIVRVLSGGAPDGANWQRRLLERAQVFRLLQRALEVWPVVDSQLEAFEAWLTELSS